MATPPAPRRLGTTEAKSRSQLLDAARDLMLEEGYAAVTSRRVAARAGLKPQLVHYYFRTMEDLFLAVFRRRAEEGLARQEEAIASPQPVRALWELASEPRGNTFTIEFTALANHRKTIRTEIATYAERFRSRQLDVLQAAFEARGIDPADAPPALLAVLMTGVSQVLVMEGGLGMSMGHAETRAFVEEWLVRLEGEAATPT